MLHADPTIEDSYRKQFVLKDGFPSGSAGAGAKSCKKKKGGGISFKGPKMPSMNLKSRFGDDDDDLDDGDEEDEDWSSDEDDYCEEHSDLISLGIDLESSSRSSSRSLSKAPAPAPKKKEKMERMGKGDEMMRSGKKKGQGRGGKQEAEAAEEPQKITLRGNFNPLAHFAGAERANADGGTALRLIFYL